MTLQEALKYSTNRTHSDFVDAALAQPESEVHPLVYADWLQEQGQEGLAEQVRAALKGKWQIPVTAPTLPTKAPKVGIQFSDSGIKIKTTHPSSGEEGAQFTSYHLSAQAKDLLNKMDGVEGREAALSLLQRRYPQLFPAPAPKSEE